MINLGTVFSGIGAVEQALERMKLEHNIIFACDNDKFVKKSYQRNYSFGHWFDDIKDIKNFKSYKINLLVGGSPCQSFSTMGNNKGFKDDRGNLVHEFIRVVGEIQPDVFIYENVPSSRNFGIFDLFKKLGYQLHKEILNAKDYGIPQNRKRLFIVGFKEPRKFQFPKPFPLKKKMQDLLNPPNFVNEKYYLHDKNIKFIHSGMPSGNGYVRPSAIPPEESLTGETPKNRTDLQVARTILGSVGKTHRAVVDNYISVGERFRMLMPIECLRLMGFDDSFQQVVSDTQMYKQAGNSIVVDVLIEILKEIYKMESYSL